MFLKRKLVPDKPFQYKMHHEEKEACMLITEKIGNLLPNTQTTPVVVVCIGTDRSTGDALGPLVGTKLHTIKAFPFHVYGTLDDPVHAVNLKDKLKMIEQKHPDAFIIGIDACLGKLNHVGMVSIGEGPVKPGAGVNKELPPVGDMHLTGIVNVSGFMEYFVLQNTRLSVVMKMAELIADSLYFASMSQRVKKNITPLPIKEDLYAINKKKPAF
ncbi:spore protease YyaC [Fictibacillus enclensis]|uniref:Sporulation protein n=1 Tax=Fictibacillus enclensis TaxID=1017270 RepID=A0A0V8J3H1_9BACL|nr:MULTISPECIES: spore protease YyaC [Fictibacillus]KSU81685.1 sporulation protein [Fictibacillus enclensis]MDM5201577.1 spore protease YyaC [Fictibacillus enclensis]MDM5340980.1 spore protease YyaC [Fictibacillus enclensis]RXZ01110.1 spore protease YyaC [Fictibacillus sp. S7]WHY72397.1 spore protease YyaC [Fictibacillus enclensis]